MAAQNIQTKLFINNEYVNSSASETLTIHNPYDDSIVTTSIQVAGEAEVNAAVKAAKAASGPWSRLSGAERGACMLRFADLVEKNIDELARLESICMGKPISLLYGFDIPHMIGCYRYYAGWADKIDGESFTAEGGVHKIIRHEPLGVCAGIASWNATFLYAAWKIAPAVAAGNAFIFKASEKAPLAMLAMARLYAEAGFPPGIVQFVSGGPLTGALLSSHKDIAKISITGSIGAGIKVQNQATSSNLKKVVLELGGKSPSIVFNDADIATALNCASQGFLMNSGQICAATSRLYVQEDIAPKFIEQLVAAFENAAQGMGGDPLDRNTALGPLADKIQMERVLSYIEEGKKSATLLAGGKRIGDKGCFVAPTLFSNPAPDNKAYKEEIFGPVLFVRTFKDEEEALALANDSTFGLVASVYTKDLDRAFRVSSALEAGGVSINGPFIPSYQTPFGGYKQSGIGKELGKYGLLEYMKTKSVHFFVNSTAAKL